MGDAFGKILLLDLPDTLCSVIKEQCLNLTFEKSTTFTQGHYDLVLLPKETSISDLPQTQPHIFISLTKQIRLSTLAQNIYQFIEAPSLYMDDFKIGHFTFSPTERRLFTPDQPDIVLTDKECDILCYLARRAPAAVSRDILLKHIWHYQEGIDTHTLETHMYRLRQKIESSADQPQILLTTEGGYKLSGLSDSKETGNE